MNKEIFVKNINNIKNLLNKLDQLYDATDGAINLHEIDEIFELIVGLIELLEIEMNDTNNNIAYFIFEWYFGAPRYEDGCEVDEINGDSAHIDLGAAEKLYDYLNAYESERRV